MRMKMLASGIALSLAVGSAAAQQPAPAAGGAGMVVTTALRNEGARYATWLMTAFDSVPAGKYGFRPTPQQMTVGDVAQHLESANYLLCALFGGMPHAETAKDSLPDSVKATWPKDTLVARLKASFAFCKSAIEKVTDANLTDSVPTGPPFIAKKNARARLVILYVTDLVDHYSQMANYMRLNGMIPPSSYPPPKH